MLSAARELALEILDEDPNMELPKNRVIVETVKKIKQKKTDWSNIS
jgi:hypothetical protein